MSLVDPECYPQFHGDDRCVCAGCFDDGDLKSMIREAGEYGACDFCGTPRAKVVELSFVTQHIGERANTFYGKAVEQLPYESAEGGYQGENFDTYELLTDHIGIELPRDDGELLDAIASDLGDDQWCAYDWTQLELNESMAYSWRRFSEIVKHERRFFFQGSPRRGGPPDDRSPIQFFLDLRDLLERLGRVRTYQPGLRLFRARPRAPGQRHTTPAALGPPPPEFALQANRMNPPGIPMFYGADSERLAVAEVRNQRVSLAMFETTRELRIIDLVDLPSVPGFFSDASRRRIQGLDFLREFAVEISLPVPRDERVHVDYLPTQIFTEFLRDARFGGLPVDGIRYPSATPTRGANVVLFATQADVVGAVEADPWPWDPPRPWLRLAKVTQKRGVAVT